ncbi:MAG: DUF1223 domain-containing protein [Opitutaceae bacterium]
MMRNKFSLPGLMFCMRPFLFFGVGLLAMSGLRGGPAHFTSGDAQASLVELFTSEGCSSCPPAERWLATLQQDPGLWRDFVPVAFHVDYWNRLGWPDRFSTRQFTQREYDYSAAWQSHSVYTPCLVRDGAEWKNSRTLSPTGVMAGKLTVSYDGGAVHTEFTPTSPHAGDAFEVHAAILGGGITSKVTAGENGGETLHHEFIALALGMTPLGHDLALPVPKLAGVTRHALAVWVTRKGDLTPLQATGGWLD